MWVPGVVLRARGNRPSRPIRRSGAARNPWRTAVNISDREHRLWAGVAARAANRLDQPISLDHVCAACVDALGVDAAGLAVFADQGTWLTAATSAPISTASALLAERVATLEHTTGQGPVSDTLATGRPTLAGTLTGSGRRWPDFAAAAGALGVRAAFAFPIAEGAVELGALHAYRCAPGPLTEDLLEDAAILADIALVMLLDGPTSGRGEPLSGLPDGRPTGADLVFQAMGMLAEQLSISLADAYGRIRTLAATSGRPPREVAHDVTTGRAHPLP